MQTYIVRVFDAEDLGEFAGSVEEPLTGQRSSFHDADELIAALRPPRGDVEADGGPLDVVRSDPSPRTRRERCGP